ncbi:hypothetical protein BJ138DRAFT_546138 [Hygrophoropsis aurantiaca]|uniref:Uncharacterized protein n=1 Tax=Hygrophoropsis aurantiaca TaxID=72124 RepID=A0ACB8A136_9AGAM|nr:hypothetical protein BJ138DRAFT_546138 [Hygrophoropsis aurantiaca]
MWPSELHSLKPSIQAELRLTAIPGNSSSYMFQNLPFEILYKIISDLPIKSILILGQVSKLFNQVIRDRSIWAHAYRTSSLVRPGGPFTWQTAQMLESNLTQSARLNLNWPPNPNPRPTRSHVITTGSLSGFMALIRGRWLLRSMDSLILCHDLDRADIGETSTAEEPYSILYECREHGSRIDNLLVQQTLLGERSGNENHPVGFALVTVYNAQAATYLTTLYSIIILADGIPMMHMIPLSIPLTPGRISIGPRFLAVYEPRSFEIRDTLFIAIENYQRYKFPETTH